ncbi:MAG: LysM domain-containing protein [Rhodocyclaceae bacterium]|nr:LysM domain-containing protein [Rhodocyclaceae bacterium]
MLRIISALILAVTAACAIAAEPVQLVNNPPDRHIVVRGDTLWGISGKFLKQPWRWPEVWRMNREQIKNPHLIYPGDIILLDDFRGGPRLRVARPHGLQPKIYSEAIEQEIPSIPANVIEPFISKPLVIEAGEHAAAPRFVASQEDRVFMGIGDTGFVTGIPDTKILNWHVYRPGKPLRDPDTQEIVGHEAFFLGSATLVQAGEPAVMRITEAREEIGRGDRLVPAPPFNLISYVPHRPEAQVEAKVMSIYGGVNEAGKYSVVSISRGKNAELEPGHILALFRTRVSQGYDDNDRRVTTSIPEERYALAFVFRVFDRVAYALVVETSKPVIVGDAARNP